MAEGIKDVDRPFRVTCIDKNGVRFLHSGHMTLGEAEVALTNARNFAQELGLKNVKYEAHAK